MTNNLFEEFKKLGYTDEEARELAKAAEFPCTINTEIDIVESMKSLIDQFNSIGCTSFRMTADELRQLGI